VRNERIQGTVITLLFLITIMPLNFKQSRNSATLYNMPTEEETETNERGKDCRIANLGRNVFICGLFNDVSVAHAVSRRMI
jgi:cytochrome c-type biogenesis protein CcmE